MKLSIVLVLFFLNLFVVYAQDPFLTIASKDSINKQPQFKSSLGVSMKLNGYYDFFGGLNDNETFNVGLINVFGNDDENSLNIDLYQTQIKLATTYVQKDGKKIDAVVEFDFWGGNGKMRLRKAFVQLEHWQIGQNWNNFGNEELWPNIMEWEGPPSGIWLRTPHVKYFNTFKNTDWIYELSLEAPITDYNRFDEFEPLVQEANQTTPDATFAVKYKKEWGHIRMSSIVRNIKYKLDDASDNFWGYGLSLSGIYKVNKNSFQYQLVGGKGITAYMTSVAGLGYDGFPTTGNGFSATPSFGGWMAYEYFITEKLHANAVLGYTKFTLDDMNRYILADDFINENIVAQGSVEHYHYYGILNFMYDAYERMTVGLELDYGVKNLDANGFLNNQFINQNKSRDAMRMSFGFMFYF
jgi:hypothetical protein